MLLVVGINVLLRWVLELLVHPILVDGLLLLLVVETVELLLLVRNWHITTVLLVRDVKVMVLLSILNKLRVACALTMLFLVVLKQV